MSNIGATNSSNIDAQLAAKRAEEERQKAQAAKLAAEQKAKVEAQKAQADAKSAAAQKGKDAQSTKTKAENVSIHTAQKTDITATQTSAAKVSVHTQAAETKTKETTPQETKSSSPNSATKKVDYGECLSRAITGGNGASLIYNQFSTETTSGDTVNLSGSGQTSLSSMNASYEIGLTGNIQNLSDNTKDLTIQVLDPNSKANKLVMLSSMDVPSGCLTLGALNGDIKVLIDLDTLEKITKELGFKNVPFYDYEHADIVQDWKSKIDKRKEDEVKKPLDFVKNTKEFCARRLQYAAEDAEYFDKIVGDNFHLVGKFIEHFEDQSDAMKVSFLHWAAKYSEKLYSDEKLTKKLGEILTSDNIDVSVKAAALYSIARNEKLSKDDKERFFARLDANNVQEKIKDQIRAKCLTKEESDKVIADFMNALNEFAKEEGAGAQKGADISATGAAASCQDKKQVRATYEAGDNNNPVRSKALGQAVSAYKKDLQTKAVECAMELPKEGRQAAISRLHELDKENQVPATHIICSHRNTTEDDRILLSSQIPKFDENVQTEASRVFLAEKRNTESARVMTAFTEQITNIASTVPVSAVESNYVNSGVTTPSELVKPDKPVGLWGIARSLGGQISAALAEYGIMSGVKPTVAQFVDMLDKEILSAELVVKAGFKDALIQQFSSLSSDAQVAVLGTLTTEEKIMMRKKGLLPRRFWDQVEKQVAQKALEGGDVSNTDAKLLASTASNSVLYQCLNDSSIRLSAQSRSLFQKTLIDNHYLKRDGNGQYKKA